MYRAIPSLREVAQPASGYFQDINEGGLLSAEEERQLADAIVDGDMEARSRLIRSNLRLVVKIAVGFQGRGLTLDDLVGEGNLGLIKAAERFEPRYGTRFSTYAAYWIKQSIREALNCTTNTIRLPAHMVQLISRWRKTERRLHRELGRPIGFEEVASILGLSDAQKGMVVKAQRALHTRLESNLRYDEDLPSNLWSDEGTAETRSNIEGDDERTQLSLLMKCLDSRERAVLRMRFGLDGKSPMTLRAIGNQLGVTREWVRKLALRAERKLACTARGSSADTPVA